MPVVAMPDGAQVSFPDEMPPDQIRSMILQKFPSVGGETAQPSVAGDIAKGAAGGLARGAIGMAGLPGDASALVHSMLPQPPPQQPLPEGLYGKMVEYLNKARGALELPTSNQIQHGVENVTGPLPEAQTVPGQYAQTAGEFAPAALAPGGIARRLAQVAIPAAASETAGQLTQGTEAEPYARAGAAILGGAAGARAAEGRAARTIANAAPANADIKASASNTYDALTARNNARPVSNAELKDTAQEIRDALNRNNLRPANAPEMHAAVNALEKPATANLGDVNDLVAARQVIKYEKGSQIALPILDKKIEQWSPGTMKELQRADQDYSTFKAGEAIDKKLYRAELRNSGDHSGLNSGNKIRQKITDYLVSNDSRFLTDENRKTLEGVVHAGPVENFMRAGSNLLGGGGGVASTFLGLVGAGAGAATGHPEAAMLPMLGLGLRMGANRGVAARAAKAQAQMRGRSNRAQTLGMPTRPPGLNAPQAALLNSALAMPLLRQLAPQQ
jgi:hypothetical protein